MVSWVCTIFMDSPSPLHKSGVKMTQRCQLLADIVLSCFHNTLGGLFVTFGATTIPDTHGGCYAL